VVFVTENEGTRKAERALVSLEGPAKEMTRQSNLERQIGQEACRQQRGKSRRVAEWDVDFVVAGSSWAGW